MRKLAADRLVRDETNESLSHMRQNFAHLRHAQWPRKPLPCALISQRACIEAVVTDALHWRAAKQEGNFINRSCSTNQHGLCGGFFGGGKTIAVQLNEQHAENEAGPLVPINKATPDAVCNPVRGVCQTLAENPRGAERSPPGRSLRVTAVGRVFSPWIWPWGAGTQV